MIRKFEKIEPVENPTVGITIGFNQNVVLETTTKTNQESSEKENEN